MKNLVQNIFEKNFDSANQISTEKLSEIVEQKLVEMKKIIMAKEQRQAWTGMPGSRQEKLYRGVIEEDDLEEMNLTKEPSAVNDIEDRRTSVVQDQGKTSLPGTQNTNDEGKGDLKTTVIQKNIKEAMGTYRAGYKYDPVQKSTTSSGTNWSQTATKGLDNKPDYAGKTQELRTLDNTLSSDGKQSSSLHDTIKSVITRPDKNDGTGGDYDVSSSRTLKQTSVQEENEELDEARINIVKARIRGGKIQRRKKVSNVPGMTIRGGKLTRMSPAERRRRKMGQRKGKMKRRAKMARSLMKRRRSLQKRRTLGLG